MRRRNHRRTRIGFALPMAIVLLVTFSLAVALLIDGAVASFRSAGADLELTRVAGAAETALATGLEARLDTAAWHAAPGTILLLSLATAPDSVSTLVQMLSAPTVRIVSVVKATRTGFRVSVGRLAYARLLRDSTAGIELRIVRVRPGWWVPIP